MYKLIVPQGLNECDCIAISESHTIDGLMSGLLTMPLYPSDIMTGREYIKKYGGHITKDGVVLNTYH